MRRTVAGIQIHRRPVPTILATPAPQCTGCRPVGIIVCSINSRRDASRFRYSRPLENNLGRPSRLRNGTLSAGTSSSSTHRSWWRRWRPIERALSEMRRPLVRGILFFLAAPLRRRGRRRQWKAPIWKLGSFNGWGWLDLAYRRNLPFRRRRTSTGCIVLPRWRVEVLFWLAPEFTVPIRWREVDTDSVRAVAP